MRNIDKYARLSTSSAISLTHLYGADVAVHGRDVVETLNACSERIVSWRQIIACLVISARGVPGTLYASIDKAWRK